MTNAYTRSLGLNLTMKCLFFFFNVEEVKVTRYRRSHNECCKIRCTKSAKFHHYCQGVVPSLSASLISPMLYNIWAPSSEFVSSSIPSWQILTAHAQPFRGARDLAFCLKVPLDSLLVWASSEGSAETARMHRLAWTFAARIGYKYQMRLTLSIWCLSHDITVIQWITLCHKNCMTTRYITFWRIHVTS